MVSLSVDDQLLSEMYLKKAYSKCVNKIGTLLRNQGDPYFSSSDWPPLDIDPTLSCRSTDVSMSNRIRPEGFFYPRFYWNAKAYKPSWVFSLLECPVCMCMFNFVNKYFSVGWVESTSIELWMSERLICNVMSRQKCHSVPFDLSKFITSSNVFGLLNLIGSFPYLTENFRSNFDYAKGRQDTYVVPELDRYPDTGLMLAASESGLVLSLWYVWTILLCFI